MYSLVCLGSEKTVAIEYTVNPTGILNLCWQKLPHVVYNGLAMTVCSALTVTRVSSFVSIKPIIPIVNSGPIEREQVKASKFATFRLSTRFQFKDLPHERASCLN